MQRRDIGLAMVTAICIVAIGCILAALSVASMRMAYRRAYSEIASSCSQVSVLTVDGVRYFCAPVARIESAGPAIPEPLPGTPATSTRL